MFVSMMVDELNVLTLSGFQTVVNLLFFVK